MEVLTFHDWRWRPVYTSPGWSGGSDLFKRLSVVEEIGKTSESPARFFLMWTSRWSWQEVNRDSPMLSYPLVMSKWLWKITMFSGKKPQFQCWFSSPQTVDIYNQVGEWIFRFFLPCRIMEMASPQVFVFKIRVWMIYRQLWWRNSPQLDHQKTGVQRWMIELNSCTQAVSTGVPSGVISSMAMNGTCTMLNYRWFS